MDDTGNTELNCCFHCMTRMASGQTVCPVCGNDNSSFQNPDSALPEGTILAGKYLVGRVLGQGGFCITYLGLDLARNIRAAIKEYFPAGVGIQTARSLRVTPVASQEKAERYFANDEARKCSPTTYAINNRAWLNDSSGTTWWRLRSPGCDVNYAAAVFAGGFVDTIGFGVGTAGGSVRPVFWLDL